MKCGRYDCTKQAAQMPAGMTPATIEAAVLKAWGRNSTPLSDEEKLECIEEEARQSVYCNVHAGGEKRSAYPRVSKFWEPMSDEVAALARKRYDALRAEREKSNREAAEREHLRRRALAAHYWDEAAQESEYVIVYSEESRTNGVRRIWTVMPREVAESTDPEVVENRPYWSNNGQVVVSETQDWDDVINPVDISIHWSSRMSAKLSITMADAMRRAAEAAIAINVRLLEKHREFAK